MIQASIRPATATMVLFVVLATAPVFGVESNRKENVEASAVPPAKSAPVGPQVRAKILEVLEEELQDAVQSSVNERVHRSMEALRANTDNPAASTWVISAGTARQAHGTFLEDYGVVFAVQIPPISIMPRSIALVLSPKPFLRFGRTRESRANQNRRMLAARTAFGRAEQIQRLLQDLERTLQQDLEGIAKLQHIDTVQQELRQLRLTLRRIEAEATMKNRTTPLEDNAKTEAATRAGAERTADELSTRGAKTVPGLMQTDSSERDPYGAYRDAWTTGLQEMVRDSSGLAERHREINEAVTDAIVTTLGEYGAMVTGLADDHGISVIVLPSIDWSPLKRGDFGLDEFVVTARYGDIKAHAIGELSEEDFRMRVQIHDRLGSVLDP